MNLLYVLDENGNPVPEPDGLKWSEFYASINNRNVGFYKDDRCEVSTVFLGMDHQFGEGPPILWETMVFGGEFTGENAPLLV